MPAPLPTIYTDDPDAHWDFEVTDHLGNDLDWDPVEAAIGSSLYIVNAEWLGAASPVRWVRVPLTVGVTPKRNHAIYLKVPGGNDVRLGTVYAAQR